MKVLAFTFLRHRYYYKPEKVVRVKPQKLPTLKQLAKSGSILNNVGEI